MNRRSILKLLGLAAVPVPVVAKAAETIVAVDPAFTPMNVTFAKVSRLSDVLAMEAVRITEEMREKILSQKPKL